MSNDDVIELNKKTFFSLQKAAHDNTTHLYHPETELYTQLFRKNLKLFCKWAFEGNIYSMKVYDKYYVLFETYNLLVDIVRNKQAEEYLSISRATLSRLKKDGILRILYVSKAKTSYLSFQQISDPKIIRTVELRRRKGNRRGSVIPIDRLVYYNFK